MDSIITSTTWVPRGYEAPLPTRYKFDEEEFNRIAELAKLQLDDAREDLETTEEQGNERDGGAKRGSKTKEQGKVGPKGPGDDDEDECVHPTSSSGHPSPRH